MGPLTGAFTLGQSGPGVICKLQNWSLTIRCSLVSDSEHDSDWNKDVKNIANP